MADLDVPIAVRRPRRSMGPAEPSEAIPSGAEPKTPRRAKRGVRFSDPGQYHGASSSGLTPMIRRTSIGTSKRRRASTPARTTSNGIAAQSPGSTGRLHRQATLQTLRQTMDGRVERRIRRSNLRDMLNKLEQEKKDRAKVSQGEISRLKSALKSKDREIYELQNATIVIDTERIWDLEQQVADLKSELKARSRETADETRHYDWTLAARDPFADDFMDMSPEDEPFGDATMGEFITGTPSRGRNSFPTPPATSPCMPATPSSRPNFLTPKSHAGVQACFPDPAKQHLEEELESLRLEVTKLTTTLDTYKAFGDRLSQQLSPVASTSEGPDAPSSPVEALEQRIEVLMRSMSDRSTALTHLTSSITDLGFSGSDASEMITSLSSGFRAARLELEYLTPGEISLPLTSHGAEVLDLLLTRLRELAKKAKESDDAIDEYHEIEQSLRKQLDTRVSVMDGLKAEMSKAERLMNEKNLRIQELGIGNDRLKGAVDGYIRDIKELENLVERMEQQGREAESTHSAQTSSHQQTISANNETISALEAKLTEAVKQSEALQHEINKVEDSTTRHVVSMNKRHGASLALRDARVLELRGEIDRVNSSLRAAHETIRVLRLQNGGLRTQMENGKLKAKAAMDAMKEELQRALVMSQEFLDSPKRGRDEDAGATADGSDASSPVGERVGGKRASVFAGELARRQGKMRRRPDSGVELLEEDEVDF